ncbi:hypothetical protein HY486_03230 [Candidatus Woesearchaeota archaeon]|nr:hypothetical protein [Candidatus Woesearchaeota archaeon]
MKEADWNECLFSGAVVKTSPDAAKAKSLVDTANGRIEYARAKEVNGSDVNYVFEDYYSSALELFHAFLVLQGFNVNNHICLGFYARDVLKKEGLFRLFDDCRIKRNSLVYYGRKMDSDTAKDAIDKCSQLIKELTNLLSKAK